MKAAQAVMEVHSPLPGVFDIVEQKSVERLITVPLFGSKTPAYFIVKSEIAPRHVTPYAEISLQHQEPFDVGQAIEQIKERI